MVCEEGDGAIVGGCRAGEGTCAEGEVDEESDWMG